jgi:HEAT repeat protein
VGNFLRKPPTDVRVAAYTALGAIGTPHAMSLVEEALADKEAEVRSVAGAVLAARKSAATTE